MAELSRVTMQQGQRAYESMTWAELLEAVNALQIRVRILEEARWADQGLKPCSKCGAWRAEGYAGCDAEWCGMRGSD